jgi:hypothetical protein
VPVPPGVDSDDCEVLLAGDRTAAPVFRVLPPAPPPAEGCAELMTPSLPPAVVASLPQNECMSGTSDDGMGNFLLGYTAGRDYRFPGYLVFKVSDGRAERVGDAVYGSDEGPMWAFSQPSGFSAMPRNEVSGWSHLITVSHDGAVTSDQPITSDSRMSAYPAPDPSGGTVLIKWWNDGEAKAAFQRLDASGRAETDWVAIDGAQSLRDYLPFLSSGVAVALSGHTLVLQKGNEWKARWLDRSGVALTPWFGFGAQSGVPVIAMLMDGSLALRLDSETSIFDHGPWKYRFEDGTTTPSSVPDWLAFRSENVFFPVRSGRGYATWGLGGYCGRDLEVLTRSGDYCGCLRVPNLSRLGTTVGRDGSLIVGRGIEQFGTCRYDLYPQLFK